MTTEQHRAQTANARKAAHTPQAQAKRTNTWNNQLDDIRWLADAGGTVETIADRLNIKPSSLKRRLQRHREWELLDRIRTGGQFQKTGHR